MADKRHWVIGRAPDCDIVMSQTDVSGKHCRLSRDGTSWMIEDLGSSNGTFVNGKRLGAHAPISVHHGDTITLGASALPWPERPPAGAPRLAKTVLAAPLPEPAAPPRSGGGRTPAPESRSHPSRPAPAPPAPGLNWGVILGALAFVVLCIGWLTVLIMMSGEKGKDGDKDKDKDTVAKKDFKDKDRETDKDSKPGPSRGGWQVNEDFSEAFKNGDALPKNWSGKDMAVVTDQMKRPCLEATLNVHGISTAILPAVSLPGDFLIEGDAYIHPSMPFVFEGDGPRMLVKIDSNGAVKINDNAPRAPAKMNRQQLFQYRIQRKGSTLRVFLNEDLAATAALEKNTDVRKIHVGIETWGAGSQSSRLYSIKVKND